MAQAAEADDAAPVSLQTMSSNPLEDITWNRLWGQTALDTMKAIVDAGDYSPGGTVVLVTANGFWDALTASGIAGLADAPVVMTDGESLSEQAESVLSTLRPKTIIVSGGAAAVADSVADEASAAAKGATVKRCWGQVASDTAVDSFAKAASITGQAWGKSAFLCTDDSYYDALSASPVSYALHMPIFLTNGPYAISDATLSAMKDGGIESVYLVGGPNAISPDVQTTIASAGISVADRLWGQTAIDTSGEVAAFGLRSNMAADGMGVATSSGYWDALAGAAFCGRNNAVIVLVDGPSSNSITGFISDNASSVDEGFIFGGFAAISQTTEIALNGRLLDTSTLAAETVIPPDDLVRLDMSQQFTVNSITDDVFARMAGVTFPDNCPVSRDDLRYVRLLHVDADGNTKIGEMIVNRVVADGVCDIFRRLYEARYPIERIRLAEDYGGDDEASMEANNSSAFNCRPVEGTDEMSWHGYGLAIDINTLYNPYYYAQQNVVLPTNAWGYIDRTVQTPYTINHGDFCYQLFIEHGFEWGGDWSYPLDYQHFEKPLH